MNNKIGIVNLDKEPLIVQQAYLTAKGDTLLNNKEIIKELSDILAKHSIKAMLLISKNGDK